MEACKGWATNVISIHRTAWFQRWCYRLFQLFVPDDLFNHFAIQANLFAQECMGAHPNLRSNSDVHVWTPTTVVEVKKFFDLILIMGVIRKPALKMYWTTDALLKTPEFGTVMTCCRFSLLLKFSHVNDNQHAPNRDDQNRYSLYKLRPVLHELFEEFQIV